MSSHQDRCSCLLPTVPTVPLSPDENHPKYSFIRFFLNQGLSPVPPSMHPQIIQECLLFSNVSSDLERPSTKWCWLTFLLSLLPHAQFNWFLVQALCFSSLNIPSLKMLGLPGTPILFQIFFLNIQCIWSSYTYFQFFEYRYWILPILKSLSGK